MTYDVVQLRDLCVRLAPCTYDGFSHFLVFEDLVDRLADAGLVITSAPRLHGRGTPVALPVRLERSERLPDPLVVPHVEAIFDPRGDSKYTHRLVLRGVNAAIRAAGASVESMSAGDSAFDEIEVRVKYRRAGG